MSFQVLNGLRRGAARGRCGSCGRCGSPTTRRSRRRTLIHTEIADHVIRVKPLTFGELRIAANHRLVTRLPDLVDLLCLRYEVLALRWIQPLSAHHLVPLVTDLIRHAGRV